LRVIKTIIKRSKKDYKIKKNKRKTHPKEFLIKHMKVTWDKVMLEDFLKARVK
jgi:hypothetical protein